MTTDLRDKTVEELREEQLEAVEGSQPYPGDGLFAFDEIARRLSEAEQKIAERDAMLSRCLIYLERTEDGQKFIASLPASAKANAEVLRAAREQEQLEGISLRDYLVACDNTTKAVRAAKEIKP